MHCICRKELTNEEGQSDLRRENRLVSLDIDLSNPMIVKCATNLRVNTSLMAVNMARLHLLFRLIMRSLVRHRTEIIHHSGYHFEPFNQA